MAMIISDEGIRITERFFKALDVLADEKQIRGLQTFTRKYDLNRRNIQHLKANPQNTVLKPELLHYLVKDYNISPLWLLTGDGPIFQEKLKPLPNKE